MFGFRVHTHANILTLKGNDTGALASINLAPRRANTHRGNAHHEESPLFMGIPLSEIDCSIRKGGEDHKIVPTRYVNVANGLNQNTSEEDNNA
jgi:hypothetical protein